MFWMAGMLIKQKLAMQEYSCCCICTEEIRHWENCGTCISSSFNLLNAKILCGKSSRNRAFIGISVHYSIKFIRRNRKSSNNMCNSILCTCEIYGLKCVAACGQCRGEICENSEVIAVKKQWASFHVCELIT